MKKLMIVFAVLLVTLSLAGCEEKPVDDSGSITVIDFTGMTFTEVLQWGNTNKINIKSSSEYRDDVEPSTVFDQEFEAGTKLEEWDELTVYYSRGYDPDGEVVVPDFTGLSKEAIEEWLDSNDIGKYRFYETFSPDIVKDGYVKFDVEQIDDSLTNYVRRDQFNFYFSKGELEIETVDFSATGKVRGVNLGGWFVLESWMSPELFEGINGAHDETTWIINNPNAEADLIEHWETFITEEDFEFLSDIGIDYIRLPIPWWMWGDSAYQDELLPLWDDASQTHIMTDYAVTYINSVQYIDQAMTWAEEYGIDVLVDLHTAPGGQNGFDNGGLACVNEFAKPEYVTQTLLKIRDMVQHFNQFDSFWGFELLNEPGWGVPLDVLQDFYVDGYNIIRAYNPDVWVGMHDGFRGYMTSEWTEFFQSTENNFTNVFFDVHLYHVFGEWTDFDIFDHIEWVKVEDFKSVHRWDGIVPVIVGEWSGGLPVVLYEGLDQESANEMKEAFLAAQFNVFEGGFGHFFWNYQILQGSHMEWDIVRLVEAGLVPTDWSPTEETE